MHKFLYALGAWIVATVGFTGGTMVSQALNRDEVEQQIEMSQQETEFWRVVAGEQSGNSPGVGNQLGRDLREILHDSDAINDFRGNSNRYGGITDALGYDPFDETGLDCFECGPLDARTKQNLTLIRNGDLAQVTGTLVVTPPEDGFDVVPGDFGVLPAVVVWYLTGTTVAFLITKRKEEIPFVLAPIPLGADRVVRHLRQKRLDDQVRAAFPEHMRMLDQTDRVLDRYGDDPAALPARERRDQVLAELQAQTRAGNDGSTEIDSLTQQLGETMEYLHLRAEARKELG